MTFKVLLAIAALALGGCFYGGGYGGGGYRSRAASSSDWIHRDFENTLHPVQTVCHPQFGGGSFCQTI